MKETDYVCLFVEIVRLEIRIFVVDYVLLLILPLLFLKKKKNYYFFKK